jgi:hypothetical protein
MKKTFLFVVLILTLLSTLLTSSIVAAESGDDNAIVEVQIESSAITWMPLIGGMKYITVTVTGPGGYFFKEQYSGSAKPSLSNDGLLDGTYNFEVVLAPDIQQDTLGDQAYRGIGMNEQNGLIQSGVFSVLGGSFIASELYPAGATGMDGGLSVQDVVQADDLIIQGSLCTGFDCVNNEDFGFDTIILKENNLRIFFNDTSVGAFPSNDWRIVANDSASGGANFLAFEDVTGAKVPFKVTAGAPTNSLFISSNGDIGRGTSTPVLDFHANTSDTPGIRLEQNSSGGFTAQTWDIGANEANFFVRDVTGGSKLPLRIRPGAPTSSLDIAANGNIGVGTAAPTADLDVSNTGANTIFIVRRTDGAILRFAAGLNQATIGTSTDSPFAFQVNSITKMSLASNGTLTVQGPVNATAFNVSSDKHVKENFAQINTQSVLERLSAIPITTWNYKENDGGNMHMGPMAQDFYAAFGLGTDNKHISTVDADGVAFASIQALYQQNQSLQTEVDALHAKVMSMESGTQPALNWAVVVLIIMNLLLLGALGYVTRRDAISTK